MEKQINNKLPIFDLSIPQENIWLTEQLNENTDINHIYGTLFINKKMDIELLKIAVNRIIENNDALRLRILQKDGKPMQYVSEYEYQEIPVYVVEEDKSNKIEEIIQSVRAESINLLEDKLCDFRIIACPNCVYICVKMHHIVADAWSMAQLFVEHLGLFYEQAKNQEPSEKKPSYLNYIQKNENYKHSEKYKKDQKFWQEYIKHLDCKNELDLTKDKKSKRLEKRIENSLYEKIASFCKKNNMTEYSFFLGIISIYFSKLFAHENLVIGTPFLNRKKADKELDTMGMFIATLPLGIEVSPELNFVELCKQINHTNMSCFRHSSFPYQEIQREYANFSGNHTNLYEIVFSYQMNNLESSFDSKIYKNTWIPNDYQANPLFISYVNYFGEHQLCYDYWINSFQEIDIDYLHERLIHIINQVLKQDNLLIEAIEIITPEEKHKILYEFNDTSIDYPKDKTIVDLFEEQVAKTPDNIAVVLENEELSYRELNEKANNLARHLIQNDVKPNDIIGIFLHKSLEVVISMLAILKAGATFLPLDIDYPENRLNYIIDNSNPKVILTSKNISIKTSVPVIYVDLNEEIYKKYNNSNLKSQITPESLMYVMYTSGSTGNPKGVMIKHKNIIRLAGFPNFIQFSENEIMVQTGTIVFDACIFEIFGSLLHGFKLHILKKENLLNIKYFTDFLKNEKVTILFLTTGLFNQLGLENPQMFKNLKYLLTGGDVISKASIENIKNSAPDLKIINCYGPTENGSYSTCYSIVGNEEIIPIGKPITNSTAYVMSKNETLLPIGTVGELWVGGDGVGKGYLNRKDLTKEKFIDDPFSNGTIYKTGDLVKWLPDGNLIFIGRIDNQVKIRGFRIELSEIDKQILATNNIKHVITIVQNINQTKTICSYIISDEQINIANLKHTLEKQLPNYMIPNFITQLKDFPLNINGKVDIKALPIPTINNSERSIVPARNKLDKLIITILQDILNINNISIEDSFFELGGDSLSAITFTTMLIQKLNISITVKDIFEKSTIKELSDYIASLSKQNNNKIKPAKPQEHYPTSSAQKRIYYASILDENSILYNVAGGIIIDKILDISLLKKCFENLIERHEILRTHFKIIENDIAQIIEKKIDFDLPYETDDSNTINDIYNHFVKPFDLKKAPLFRAKAVYLKNEKTLLLLDMHHIISDGTSLTLLLQELCDLYNGYALPEKQVDYKDFTIWEQEQFQKADFQKAKDFWVDQYQDEIPLLNMPTTFSRPSTQSFEGANYHATLSKDIFDKVNEIAKSLEITPYMLLLAAYYILLFKYTAQNDIVIGTPIIGRESPELYQMLGMFVNTLPLKNTIHPSTHFKDFVAALKNYCLTVFENQSYPFDELVKELNIKRDASRNPLFDVMFVYQNNGYPTIDFEKAQVEYFIPDNNISKFDLTLEVIPTKDEFSLRFEYCTKLFDENFIKRFSTHYTNILKIILQNSTIKIADIDMLSTTEKNQILHDFNDTYMNYPHNKTITDLFEEQVKKVPHNIAVIFEDKKLTYHELNKRANILAHTLISKGVHSGDVVGIYMNRSIELIISILATLKVGAVYMPMYIGYPQDRLTYMLKNSASNFLITTRKYSKAITCDHVKKILINNRINPLHTKNPPHTANSTDLAYCIYTSGSTGKPKGVQITHKNLINFVYSFNKYYHGITAKDSFLASTNISFDVSIWEIFMPLLNGAKLVLNTEEIISDITLYCDTIIKNKITSLYIPPNILEEVYSLLSKNKKTYLDKLLVGVEPIRKSTLNKYFTLNSNLTIINGYGPSETTICATALHYIKDETQDGFVSIGKPLKNTNIYILNPNHNLCPIGIPGELYIAGDGVGNGYLNNRTETNKLFIKEPFNAYKTGDLAKWNENGTIDFIGRNDNQIKLSGYRIELNEINHTILSYPNILKCYTTILKNKNNSYLTAYFVSDNQISIKDLKSYLQTKLTFYMIPKFLIQIDSLPMTVNGKVDKKSLPLPNFKSDAPYIAPRNPYEKKIAKIIRKAIKHAKSKYR